MKRVRRLSKHIYWGLEANTSSSWRCSTIVRDLNLELRSEAEVETGWIKKVKGLAEAFVGKMYSRKRRSIY